MSVYNNETLSLIIAPHAFSFCERFVNLCLGNWLKHVFLRFYFKLPFTLKNKKNTLTEKIKVFLHLIST
ncbi:hypothetical protein BS612_00785 [Listeria monocytogenes]|nr:hypothetical protein BS612_00785 [Listeria monocytogenes]